MQISRKLPLSSIDTFMFNDARSGLSETRCYDVLENIKDDRSIASKYSSEMIQFKTPNVMIVFSNADPGMTQLSKDRWKVFYINKDGLSSQEKRLWNSKSSRKRSHNCRNLCMHVQDRCIINECWCTKEGMQNFTSNQHYHLLLHRRKRSGMMPAPISRMTIEEMDKIVDDRVT